MKRYCIAITITLFVATIARATDQSWSGTISDRMCGADHTAMAAKQSDRDCTLTCARAGTPYALLTDGKVYQLLGHEGDLKTHAGHAVTITGDLKKDAIRVSKVEMRDGAR